MALQYQKVAEGSLFVGLVVGDYGHLKRVDMSDARVISTFT